MKQAFYFPETMRLPPRHRASKGGAFETGPVATRRNKGGQPPDVPVEWPGNDALPVPEETMNQERRGIRFGVVAVERGFITPEQLVAALQVQVEENLQSSQHRLIGMILLEQGLLTLEQIDEILNELG